MMRPLNRRREVATLIQRIGPARVLGVAGVLVLAVFMILAGFAPQAKYLLTVLPLFVLGATTVAEITEGTTPEAHKQVDMSLTLAKMRSDIFTLDTIMRRLEASGRGLGGRTAKATKVRWEEDEEIPRGDTINGAVAAGSAAASVNWTVDNGSRWRADDLIYLPENGTTPGAVVWVQAVNGNVLTVYRLDQSSSESAFGTVPAVTDGEEIARLSNAKEDYANASDPRATMPVEQYNYVQHIDAVISASEIRLATKNYTQDDWMRSEGNTVWDFRMSLEFNGIFGQRTRILDPTSGRDRFTMGGIVRYLSTHDETYTTGSLTESGLIDIAKNIFTGNSGSRLRWWFSAPNQTAEIDKILIASGTLQSTRGEKVLGVEATRIHTTFGDLMLINHPGLSLLGKTNWGLILDPTQVRRVPLINMKTKDIEDNDRHGRSKQWYEVATYEVRYEKTHAVVRDTATDSFA